MKSIKVYGPGCTKCENMTALVKDVSNELGLNIPVEKVTDVMQFAVAGVIVTPALVIDGKVVVSGRVPSRDEMRELLQTSNNQTAETPQEKKKTPCGCGSGGCCGSGAEGSASPPKKSSFWQKLIVWIVIILVAIAAIKLANRKAKESGAAPGAAATIENPVAKDNRVELVYYQYGARCATCVRMEKWASETINAAFRNETDQGILVWHSLPADEQAVNRYGLTSKSIVIKTFKDGTETGSKTMDRIWDLNRNEEEFKKYLEQGVRETLKNI